jgi:predicted enzyme related to lactoylglutathione lyase
MLTLGNVTFDCADPIRLAEFWSRATGFQIAQQSGYMTVLSPAEGRGPNLLFIKVPEPRTVKNRVHPDFHVADIEAEIARLIELGATRGESHREYGFIWTVMSDPEGNEFCVGHAA